MSMECPHNNIHVKEIATEFLGMTFRAETKVCKDCGAYLHGPAFENAYKQWLEEMYRKKRPKFQVQCHFSDNLIHCAQSFLESHPGVSVTVYLRILATSYLNIIDGKEELSERFEDLLDEDIFNSLKDRGGRNRVNIQFKPSMMVDIVAISEVLEMRMSQVVEESILKMMAAIVSQDPEMKRLWEKEVSATINVLLKSA